MAFHVASDRVEGPRCLAVAYLAVMVIGVVISMQQMLMGVYNTIRGSWRIQTGC